MTQTIPRRPIQSPIALLKAATDNGASMVLLGGGMGEAYESANPAGTYDVHMTGKKVLLAATMRRSFVGIATTDYLVSSVVTMRCRNNK